MKLLPILLILSIGTAAQHRTIPQAHTVDEILSMQRYRDSVTVQAPIAPAQYNQVIAEFNRINVRLDTLSYRINLILLNQRK